MSAGVVTAKATDVVLSEPEEVMQVDSVVPPNQDEDLYTRLKTLQRQLEFLEIQVRHMKPPHQG